MKIIIIFAILLTILFPEGTIRASSSDSCVDIQFVFVRGSGSPLSASAEYLAFEKSIKHETKDSKFAYEITDLQYPAVEMNDFAILIGTYISAGKTGAFASSVNTGIASLVRDYYRVKTSCPATKWVIFGYSQGAKVVADALRSIDPEDVAYIALFGDPKLYLPEGEGILPPACSGKNLSTYRTHVPNCHTSSGILGARNPYIENGYSDKVGLWCNDRDLACGSSKNIFENSGHMEYADASGIPAATKLAMQKIKHILPAQTIILEDVAPSAIDVMFIVDLSNTSHDNFVQYRPEAIRLATEITNHGGSVSLFTFRKIGQTDMHSVSFECNLSCSMSEFTLALYRLNTTASESTPKSTVRAINSSIDRLIRQGDNPKAMIILTDSEYSIMNSYQISHDGTVRICNENDTRIYVIAANNAKKEQHEALTSATNGQSVEITSVSELSKHLFSRQQSRAAPALRRSASATASPDHSLSITESTSDSVQLSWQNPTSNSMSLLIVDEVILGRLPPGTSKIIITDLDFSIPHEFIIRSLDENGNLGESATASLPAKLVQVSSTPTPVNPVNSAYIGVPSAGVK